MRNRAALVAVVVAAVLVAACGSSSTPAPTAAPATAPPIVESPTPEVAAPTPEVVTPTPAPAYTIYVVKKGDTLYAIAIAHHTTIKKILALNPAIKDPAKIRIGQKIEIPTS